MPSPVRSCSNFIVAGNGRTAIFFNWEIQPFPKHEVEPLIWNRIHSGIQSRNLCWFAGIGILILLTGLLLQSEIFSDSPLVVMPVLGLPFLALVSDLFVRKQGYFQVVFPLSLLPLIPMEDQFALTDALGFFGATVLLVLLGVICWPQRSTKERTLKWTAQLPVLSLLALLLPSIAVTSLSEGDERTDEFLDQTAIFVALVGAVLWTLLVRWLYKKNATTPNRDRN